MGTGRADGAAQIVGRIRGHGQVEGPHLRRPDGPPLGLLGRRLLPPYLHRRTGQGPRDGRHGHHARCTVGRPAGALFRHGRNRLEQRRHDAGLYLQAAHRHRIRRFDRLGHLRLCARKRRDAEHLQAGQCQYRGARRKRQGRHGRLRQIPRMVARRYENRLPFTAPRRQRVGQGTPVPLRLPDGRHAGSDGRFRLQRHERRLGGQRHDLVHRTDRGDTPALPHLTLGRRGRGGNPRRPRHQRLLDGRR